MGIGFIKHHSCVNFSAFPDLWVWFFVKLHILVKFFGIFRFTGMLLRNFLGVIGINFRIFFGYKDGIDTIGWQNPLPRKLNFPPPTRMPSFVEHIGFAVSLWKMLGTGPSL